MYFFICRDSIDRKIVLQLINLINTRMEKIKNALKVQRSKEKNEYARHIPTGESGRIVFRGISNPKGTMMIEYIRAKEVGSRYDCW